MAPHDLRDFPLPEPCLPEGAEAEGVVFAIDPALVALPETAQREPLLDAGPLIVGFDEPDADPAEREPAPPDPHRALAEPEAPTPGSIQWDRGWITDLAAAFAVHLLTLLLLLPWTLAPADSALPIPVALVYETPPKPEPPPQAKPEATPPPGRLASTDIGDPNAKPTKPAAARPRTLPRPELVSALPKPAAMPERELKLAEPILPAPLNPTAAVRPAPRPGAARSWGRIPGPEATQDEYLAYANALIRHHQEMIPVALLRGRNGTAVINILVLADGAIAAIAVKESSGYPEIDRRAEQMVAAVKRFPPLPRWFRGDSMTLSYHMLFGDRMVLP